VVHVIRPYSSHRPTEIVSAPKVYAFDTGFVSCYKGWNQRRTEDLGLLWEHYVLNELHGRLQARNINYWRDKRRHEIDFVMRERSGQAHAIECKWCADEFSPVNLFAFRTQHPDGKNFVVAHDIPRPPTRTYRQLQVRFVPLEQLIAQLQPG